MREKFESLSSFQKFELYIIVVAIVFLIHHFSDHLIVHFIDKKDSPNIPLQEISRNKFFKKSDKEIVRVLHNIADNLKVDIKSIKIIKQRVVLEFKESFFKTTGFLKYIDTHFKIISFDLAPVKKLIKANIVFDKRYFYDQTKEFQPLHNIPNPFSYRKKSDGKYKLRAIVLDNVLIGKKWYKQNDTLEHYIIKIKDNNSVILIDKKGDKDMILRVYKNDR